MTFKKIPLKKMLDFFQWCHVMNRVKNKRNPEEQGIGWMLKYIRKMKKITLF